MADEEKRRGSGPQGVIPLVIPPIPDGAISAEDRRRLGGFYSFVGGESGDPGDPPPPPVVDDGPLLGFTRVSVGLSVAFIPTVRGL